MKRLATAASLEGLSDAISKFYCLPKPLQPILADDGSILLPLDYKPAEGVRWTMKGRRYRFEMTG